MNVYAYVGNNSINLSDPSGNISYIRYGIVAYGLYETATFSRDMFYNIDIINQLYEQRERLYKYLNDTECNDYKREEYLKERIEITNLMLARELAKAGFIGENFLSEKVFDRK